MSDILKDILRCLKIAFIVFISLFLVGVLIGLVRNFGNTKEVLMWGCRFTQVLTAVGLAGVAMAFVKQDLMRPLNYEKEWKKKFKKINITWAMAVVCTLSAIISYILEEIIKVNL